MLKPTEDVESYRRPDGPQRPLWILAPPSLILLSSGAHNTFGRIPFTQTAPNQSLPNWTNTCGDLSNTGQNLREERDADGPGGWLKGMSQRGTATKEYGHGKEKGLLMQIDGLTGLLFQEEGTGEESSLGDKWHFESTYKSDLENNGKNAKYHFWERADRNTQQSLLSMLIQPEAKLASKQWSTILGGRKSEGEALENPCPPRPPGLWDVLSSDDNFCRCAVTATLPRINKRGRIMQYNCRWGKRTAAGDSNRQTDNKRTDCQRQCPWGATGPSWINCAPDSDTQLQF